MLVIVKTRVQNFYVLNNTKISKATNIINKKRNGKKHQNFIGLRQFRDTKGSEGREGLKREGREGETGLLVKMVE